MKRIAVSDDMSDIVKESIKSVSDRIFGTIVKFNANHGPDGRFSSGGGGSSAPDRGGASGGTSKPSKPVKVGSKEYKKLSAVNKEKLLRSEILKLQAESMYTRVGEYKKRRFNEDQKMLNRSIGRYEGIARAMVNRAEKIKGSKNRRKALHVALISLRSAQKAHKGITGDE